MEDTTVCEVVWSKGEADRMVNELSAKGLGACWKLLARDGPWLVQGWERCPS